MLRFATAVFALRTLVLIGGGLVLACLAGEAIAQGQAEPSRPAAGQTTAPVTHPVTPPVVSAPAAKPAPTEAPTSDVQGPPAAAAQNPPRGNSGLVEEIGKLFEAPRWSLPDMPKLPEMPKMKTPAQAMDEFGKGATDGLGSVNSTTVSGRVACPTSANGAPDCQGAAQILCKSKGFKEGKSVAFDSARICSPQKLLMGHKLEASDCRSENYVTRALCQ